MNKRLASLLAAGVFSLAAFQAEAAEKVTLQLKWVTQAQFAGYYVAKDKGFYEEEGLDVDIKPGGPDIAPAQVIAGGGADVIVDWMPSALATREKGVALVNIAQPFKKSGMMLTCLKETGVTSPDKFKGQTLGVWFFGNEYPFLSWMSHLKIPTDGGPNGVTVLKQGFNVDPLIQKQAACISTMTYNEYWQVIDAGVTPEELVNFKYEDQGVATLEDREAAVRQIATQVRRGTDAGQAGAADADEVDGSEFGDGDDLRCAHGQPLRAEVVIWAIVAAASVG